MNISILIDSTSEALTSDDDFCYHKKVVNSVSESFGQVKDAITDHISFLGEKVKEFFEKIGDMNQARYNEVNDVVSPDLFEGHGEGCMLKEILVLWSVSV